MELKSNLQRIVFFVLLILPFWVNGQYETKTVKEIGRKIYDAIGMTSKDMPEIVINEHEERYVASFPPGRRNLINFELKAYRICQTLGPDSLNAIAFLLSHELGHWYKEHYFLDEASTAYAGTSAIDEINKAKETVHGSIAHETEADEFACYYSKMAGFSLKSVDNYIRAIYKGYNLPDSLPCYPSLDSRCEMAKKANDRMDTLNTVFNISTILLIEGEYESATVLLKYIVNNKFGSREIKNNLGICYAMQGLQLSDNKWDNFIFPFIIDPLSRAGEKMRTLSPMDSIKMRDFYQRAERYFAEAAALDKEYYPARINNAILLAMLQKTRSSKNMLDALEEDFYQNAEAMLSIRYARAIVDYISEGKTTLMKELADGGNENAKENLRRLNSPEPIEQKSCTFSVCSIADELQPAIRKSRFGNTPNHRIRTDEETVSLFSRDSINNRLVLLEFKNSRKFYQILSGTSITLWPDGLPGEFKSQKPNCVHKFGPGVIEKRCAGGLIPAMTYYTLKREGEEVQTFVLY